MESTLSGRSLATLLNDAVGRGYEVELTYIWIASVKLSLDRVRRRVAAGGHNIPERDVLRRFKRSLVNFDKLYRPIARSWQVYDGNSVGPREMIAFGRGTAVDGVLNASAWATVQAQMEEAE